MNIRAITFCKAFLFTLLLPAQQNAFAQDENNIKGTFYFSHQPFGATSAGGSTDLKRFRSDEFLYGRLELADGKTLNDAFTFTQDDKEGNEATFILYNAAIYKDGKLVAKPREANWNYFFLTKEDRSKNYINFDVLPDPKKATTVIGAQSTLNSTKTCAPFIWGFTGAKLSEEGIYEVELNFSKQAYSAYGDALRTYNKISTKVEFDFKAKDIQTLIATSKAAEAFVKESANTIKTLPPVFKNSKPLADPNLTAAKIKAYVTQGAGNSITVLKVATTTEGWNRALWQIQKNSLGIPEYRWVAADFYIAYKNNSDGRCYVGRTDIRQEYIGGGKYGPVYATSRGNRMGGKIIACTAIK